MARIAVTPEELQSVATRVRTVADSIEQELSQLRGQVSHVASIWEGPAQASFQELAQRWQAQARQLNETLAEIGLAIDRSAQEYQATDTRIGNVFRG